MQQTTINLGGSLAAGTMRKAQRILAIRKWLRAKSQTGSLLMGETVTNRRGIFLLRVKNSTKNLHGSDFYRTFAPSKIISGMMPHFLTGVRLLYPLTLSKKVLMKYCAVSGSGNTPGSLLINFRQHVAQFLLSKINISMNGIVLSERKAQRTFSIQVWLNAKSQTGSLIMGETVTNLQVVLVHLILLMMFLVLVLINYSMPLAFCALAAMAGLVYQLNKTEKGGDDEA